MTKIHAVFFAGILISAAAAGAHPHHDHGSPRAKTHATSPTLSPLNPIYPYNTPDPGVIYEDSKWYLAYTTSGNQWRDKGRYPIIMSEDLTSWTQVGFIFTPDTLPVWADKSYAWWAPELHKIQGKYVAYYTPRQNENRRFAVGAAVADRVEGPYRDIGKPIAATEGVGIIDVSFYHDPNTAKNYLMWKEDGNDFDPPRPTPLVLQELTSDGLSLVGEPKEVLTNDQPWEGVLVEAPSIIHHNNWYYLFYSGNIYTTDHYSVGVARSRDIWGPYEKFPEPILVHDEHFSGPAHQFVIRDDEDNWHIFYHARLKALEGDTRRYLMHDIITFNEAEWPVINDGHPGPLSEENLQKALNLLQN